MRNRNRAPLTICADCGRSCTEEQRATAEQQEAHLPRGWLCPVCCGDADVCKECGEQVSVDDGRYIESSPLTGDGWYCDECLADLAYDADLRATQEGLPY